MVYVRADGCCCVAGMEDEVAAMDGWWDGG